MGRKPFPYVNHYAMKQARLQVLRDANYRCSVCGAPAIYIHHKDGSIDNHDPANLMAICAKCHMRLHQQTRGSLVWSPYLLRIAMMHRGLTPSELAAKVGLSSASIYNLLKTGKAKNSTMRRIAEALDYPIEFFVAEEGVSGPQQGIHRSFRLPSRKDQSRYQKLLEAIDRRVGEIGGDQRLLKCWLAADLRARFNVKSYYLVADINLSEALDLIRIWRPGLGFDSDVSNETLDPTGTEGGPHP